MLKSGILYVFVILVVHIAKSQQHSPVTLFALEILSAKVETSPSLTPDGNVLFFVLRDSFYVMNAKTTIMYSERKSGKWQQPRVASFSGQYSDDDPFVSPDGKRIYFTSDRPERNVQPVQNHKDIWYVNKTKRGWSTPARMPDPVNSPKSEYGPSVDSAGNLYFGSYREGGMGSGDVWVSKFSFGNYSEPENLGTAINTSGGNGIAAFHRTVDSSFLKQAEERKIFLKLVIFTFPTVRTIPGRRLSI